MLSHKQTFSCASCHQISNSQLDLIRHYSKCFLKIQDEMNDTEISQEKVKSAIEERLNENCDKPSKLYLKALKSALNLENYCAKILTILSQNGQSYKVMVDDKEPSKRQIITVAPPLPPQEKEPSEDPLQLVKPKEKIVKKIPRILAQKRKKIVDHEYSGTPSQTEVPNKKSCD